LHGTDAKYYLHDGNMTTTKPAYSITHIEIYTPDPKLSYDFKKGSAIGFDTIVRGVGDQSQIPQDVYFQVIANGSTGVQISYTPVPGYPNIDGSVTIPVNEPSDAVIVRIISKADPTVYVDYTLKFASNATVGGGQSSNFAIKPNNVVKKPGGCVNFDIYQQTTKIKDSKIDWVVIGATSSKTHITASGTLHIGSDEQLNATLVVRGYLKDNQSIYSDATVYVSK
jgi:hypothetical protein